MSPAVLAGNISATLTAPSALSGVQGEIRGDEGTLGVG